MERLTARTEQGDEYIPEGFSRCKGEGTSEQCRECEIEHNLIYSLAAYEDLGVTPEQLHEVNKLYLEKCKEVNGLREELAGYKDVGEKLRELEKERKEIRNKVIEEALGKSAKAICIGCGYLNGHECTYNGANCGVSKPMLEAVTKALEQMKETEEPFFNFDSPVVDVDKKVIRKFAEWCYINGIDFSYMSTTKKNAKQFIDDVIERYGKEQMKEVGE